MDSFSYAWVEIVFVFGGMLAFCAWQWLDVRRLQRERQRAQESDPGKVD